MTRAVVNVATTPQYQRGQDRLVGELAKHGAMARMFTWPRIPSAWRDHETIPYGFKGCAMKYAFDAGSDLLLWCDASILPIRSLEPLWQRIERDGYWFSKNGYSNYEWTADSAYPYLFQQELSMIMPEISPSECRAINRRIPHVVATAFGLNVRHPKGRAFLDEYFRLASETRAFCGPWVNFNRHDGAEAPVADGVHCAPCGPPDVRGHRHDQTAASVIAWRLGFELTSPPDIFAYKGGETEQTILVADGSVLA